MTEEKIVSVDLNEKLQKTLLIASWARTPIEAINKVTDRYNYIISQEVQKLIEIFTDNIFELENISKSQIERKPCKLSVLQQIAPVEYIEEYWFEVRDLTKLEKKLQDNKIEEEVVYENVHSAVAALLNKIRENALKNSIL